MAEISKLQAWKNKFVQAEQPALEVKQEEKVEIKIEVKVEEKLEAKIEVKAVEQTSSENIKTFVSLRHHDEYSVKQGLGQTTDAMKIIKKYGLTHFAVTNYGEVSGWVNQYFTCVDNGVIPILGVEMFVNNYRIAMSEKDKKSISTVEYLGMEENWKKNISELSLDERDKINVNYQIIFLAKNLEGYYNIIKYHNESQINGFFNKPRIGEGFFSKHSAGIICILPFVNSEVYDLIVADKEVEAMNKIRAYKSIFEDLYLEIGIMEDDRFIEKNNKIIEFAKKNDIKCVISINSHYLEKEEADTYSMLLKLGDDSNVEELAGMHYKSYEEIESLFESKFKNEIFTRQMFDNIMSNNQEVLKKIQKVVLDTSPKLPKFENAEVLIREKSFAGLKKRRVSSKKEYVERLEYELDNIIRAGFADYFLFLEDIIIFCRENKILVGPGRGSGAGSLVLYCLDVTQVDPVKHNLLFERFLDASRLEEIIEKGGKVGGDDFPDVDVDYADKERIKRYLVDKYGKTFTCSIGTVGRMKNKSTLIDLSRKLNINLEEVYEVTKGEMKHFTEEEEKLDLESLKNLAPSLKRFLDKYPEVEKHFTKLRGTINFWGKHAGGVLVSNVPLTDQIPVRKLNDDNIASCWIEGMASRDLGRMGFLKMDILGVETLNQIQETIDLVKEYQDKELNMYDLPLEDDKAFSMCNEKDNIGIFQLDSYVAPGVISAINGAQRFEDYSVISALMRPSAQQSKLHLKFGSRRRGDEQYELPKCLTSTLGVTYGLPIYQESAYHVAKNLAGFSIVDAYKFMKLLYKGKMKANLIPTWRKKFMDGCEPAIQRGEATRTYVNNIFEELLKFQGYGFCECLALDTVVETPKGFKLFGELELGETVKAPDSNGNDVFVEVEKIMESEEEVYEVTFDDGTLFMRGMDNWTNKKIKSSIKHKYLCEDGKMRKLSQIIDKDLKVMVKEGKLIPRKIVDLNYLGKMKTRDITVNSPEHRFYANGVVVSNSHSMSYAMLSAWQLYLKAHYPAEFICCFLRRISRVAETRNGDKLLNIRVKYARQKGLKILPPSVKKSKEEFSIQDGGLRYGLSTIKGISWKGAEEIVSNQPYKDKEDFFKKVSTKIIHKGRFEALVFSGAFDEFGDREEIYNWYFRVHLKKKKDDDNQVTFDFVNDVLDEEEYKFFSKKELIEKEEEMLGLIFREELIQKYAKEITSKDLKTIEEVKRKIIPYAKIIGRVGEIIPFKTFRTKADYVKIILTDEAFDAPLVMSQEMYTVKKKYLQLDSVVAVPVKISAEYAISFYLDEREPIEVLTK